MSRFSFRNSDLNKSFDRKVSYQSSLSSLVFNGLTTNLKS